MAEVCHKPDDIWKLEHKRSNVWLHFLVNKSKKDNLSQAKCVYCNNVNNKLRKLKLALYTIPPTLVENERAFSAAGTFTTKLRTRLKPETFDTLCFLRAHLQNK